METNPSNITLRPFTLSDVGDILIWAGDYQVTGNLRWNTITSKDEALAFVRDVCIPHPWRRSICVDDRSIGFISIYPGRGDDRCRANFGFGLAPTYWGQGITTRAVKIALRQVFEDLPDVVRLEALVNVKNKASQRVLEKAGFVHEGLLRKYSYLKGQLQDLHVYSFLSTDCIIDS